MEAKVSIPLNRVWFVTEPHDWVIDYTINRLNPLESGLVCNYIEDGDTLVLAYGLNPLESGLVCNYQKALL